MLFKDWWVSMLMAGAIRKGMKAPYPRGATLPRTSRVVLRAQAQAQEKALRRLAAEQEAARVSTP
jgi:hypothetical protein